MVRADARRGHQREQSGMGWADAVGGKGRLIFLYSEWAEFSATLALRFAEFADVSLARDASDRVVWQTCQEVGQC